LPFALLESHQEIAHQLQNQLFCIKSLVTNLTLNSTKHHSHSSSLEVILKQCAILCGTGLASLLGIFSIDAEWQRQSIQCAMEVVCVTASLADDDHRQLDAVTSVGSVFSMNRFDVSHSILDGY